VLVWFLKAKDVEKKLFPFPNQENEEHADNEELSG